MNIKSNLKEIAIYGYKFVLYFFCFFCFFTIFGSINEGLNNLTRTSVITTFVFILALLFMMTIYGNFEIGKQKSKPVIFSTLVVLLFTDLFAFMALGIMGINEISLFLFVKKGAFLLLLVFLIQLVLIIVGAYFGNYIYFKMYEPEMTLIIHNDYELEKKIHKYLKSHSKQYILMDSIHNENKHPQIDLSGVDTVFLLGLTKGFRNEMIETSFFNYQNLFFNADIYDVMSGKDRLTVYDDVLMVGYSKEKISLLQSFVKRTIDIVFSLLFLILASPIFLIVGIAIKLDDGGPVFYKQQRLTKDGDIFNIIKFRSMKLDSGDKPAMVNDDRITKVGKITRSLRIDEVPQFLNILKGDMSMVGPRPESVTVMGEIMDTLPEFRYRLKVKAGLTGYAQIFGKYNTTPKQKLLMDLKYIETYSVKNDIKLIFQTVNVFFKSDSTEGF